jgi:hypothetical protein
MAAGKLHVRVLADAKAHVTEVSALAFFAFSSSSSPLSKPSSLAIITASTLRDGGGGGVIKVSLVPVATEVGAGGLVCLRVLSGMSCPAVKLQVASHD